MKRARRVGIQGALVAVASAQWDGTQSLWGRCGGSGYTGLTQCPRTAYCNYANQWYSQCVPVEVDQPPQQPVTDDPIITTTAQTTVTQPYPDPIVVTTFITYLTPRPTANPSVTVIDGTTYIMLPPRSNSLEAEYVEQRSAAPEPTEPPLLAVREPAAKPDPEPDVDNAPVFDAPLSPKGVTGFVTEALEARDVGRPPVYDTPVEADAVPVVEARTAQPDVDRAPVYDSLLSTEEAAELTSKSVEKRDVDRPPVYDTPINAAAARTARGQASKRDVDRAPIYDSPLSSEQIAELSANAKKRDVDRDPVYDSPISPTIADRDIDKAPVYDPPLANNAAAAAVKPRAPTPTILAKGQYWIRAVVPPNYHKYLQTKVANTIDVAILGPAKTAGQFSIQGGQLVEAAGADPLYLHVERPADYTQRTLATWFNSTKNDFGAFAWQGDSLTWSASEVKRQNPAAWLVCKNQALFINTGAYAYQTPAGCADQTIHYYNDATAND